MFSKCRNWASKPLKLSPTLSTHFWNWSIPTTATDAKHAKFSIIPYGAPYRAPTVCKVKVDAWWMRISLSPTLRIFQKSWACKKGAPQRLYENPFGLYRAPVGQVCDGQAENHPEILLPEYVGLFIPPWYYLEAMKIFNNPPAPRRGATSLRGISSVLYPSPSICNEITLQPWFFVFAHVVSSEG